MRGDCRETPACVLIQCSRAVTRRAPTARDARLSILPPCAPPSSAVSPRSMRARAGLSRRSSSSAWRRVAPSTT
eukprot:12028425-Alexandrium_andersonii.AAC.1